MIKNFFKTAWRNIVRNKMYSIINVAGLSIGLACCMLIVLYNKDEVSYDRFQKNAQDIYRVAVHEVNPDGSSAKYGITGMMQGPVFKKSIPEVEEFVRVQGEQYNIKKGTEIFTQDALKVDSSFFTVFPSFKFAEGNAATALTNANSVVLSEEVAEKYFGHASALGKTISIDYDGGFKDFMVSAVVKTSPQNSSIKIKMLMPNHIDKNGDDQWINFYLNTFLLLNKNANIKKVETQINEVFAREAREQLAEAKKSFNYESKLTFSLQPFLSIHLSKEYPAANGLADASNPTYSYILSGIALFILLIACINFVNLTVARSLKRAKEIGVRKVIGGERKLLILQFLGESFFLSFIAFAFGLLLVQLLLPFFNSVANKELALSYLFDAKLLIIYAALFLITGFMAGFYPALVLSGFKPVDTLYGRMKLARGALLQKGLVVLQFSLAVFLIVAALILRSQFTFLTKQDLGYNDKNLVSFDAGRVENSKVQTFINELSKQPGIERVAPRNQGNWYTVLKVNGDQQLGPDMEVVDENYLPVLGLQLVKGRNFSPAFPSNSSSSVLVNEAFVKQAKWKEPIGQTIDFFTHNHKYQVVGVVKDYHYESLYSTINPQMFTTDPQMGGYGTFLVRIKPGSAPAAIKSITAAFKSIFPTRPFSYAFKSDANEKQYEKEAKWKKIISFSAALTIFISCIGLLGLATLAAQKRRKEIGIRKVVGAGTGRLVVMLTINFMKLVLLSCLIAFPLAWWAGHKFLQGYPYRVEIGAWMFVLALLITGMVAFFTIGYQSLKAALANPVTSLRTE
jgi:putative ABC transport system permease protein